MTPPGHIKNGFPRFKGKFIAIDHHKIRRFHTQVLLWGESVYIGWTAAK